MKTHATLVAIVLGLLFTAGCKSKPKAGDKCTGDEATCIDKTTILECQAGTYAQMACKGARGCAEKATGTSRSGRTVTTNYAVECDFSAAAAGEACLDDTSQCNAEKNAMVTCKDKKVTRTACLGPKACSESATQVDCDTSIQPLGADCDANDVACSPDKKTMLHCVKGKLALAANCRGAKACTVDNHKIDCDHGAQNVADPCETDGDYECSADNKSILKCGAGKWALDQKCKKTCKTTGQNVGCE
jgi:hypothetical protein